MRCSEYDDAYSDSEAFGNAARHRCAGSVVPFGGGLRRICAADEDVAATCVGV